MLAQAGSNTELEKLEAQLPISDILLYRLLAEHSTQHPAELQAPPDPETAQPASDTARCLVLCKLCAFNMHVLLALLLPNHEAWCMLKSVLPASEHDAWDEV